MTDTVLFEVGKSKYDLSCYSGRLKHFLDVVDPRTLLASNKEVEDAIALLKSFDDGKITPSPANSEKLWAAQKLKNSMIHPDTGEKIFMPFRMAVYVPFGVPIIVGILYPAKSALTVVFWQGINQSHNAMVNYSNRNATQETSTRDFLIGFAGAVSSAVGIAVGLRSLINKSTTLSPATRTLIQRFVPFPAVAVASVTNVCFMRHGELTKGISVTDANGDVVGVSQIAAKKALTETALTRMILPAPILILPPIIFGFIEKTRVYKRYSGRLFIPVQTVLAALSFGLALPSCIALFPALSPINKSELEPELQAKCKPEDSILYYNKGL